MANTSGPEHRLLVAEDDPESREHMVRILSELGYDVVGGPASGPEALRAVERYRPDLRIVSARLPGTIDDPAVARAVDEVHGTPTIYLRQDEPGGLEVPGSPGPIPRGGLRKPPDPSQIQAALELAVHRARSKRPRVQGIGLDQKVLRSPTETPWIGTAQEVQGGVLQNRTLGYPGLDPEKRKATDTRYRRLFRGGPAGAFEATLSGRITDANGALATMLGYQSRTELLERSVTDLIVDSPIPGQVLERLWEEEKILSAEVRLRTSQGDEVVGLLSTSILEAEDDDEGLITGTVMDITERKRIEADLERLAFEDPLTGLANRRAVEDHAGKYLALAERRGTRLGLIYLDLARFKEINDQHGHPAGDKVLVEVARRLEAAARDGDVVGRVGGDEFLVLLPDVAGPDAVLTVARRMDRELTDTPVDLGSDEELTVRAEMGVSLFPDHGPHLEDLIRAADEAMYQVKEGRGEDEDRPSVTIAEPPTGGEPEGDR